MLHSKLTQEARPSKELKSLEAVGQPIQKPFDGDVLRILVFSDYRVQDISLLLDFIKGLHAKPNLILYAGDDVERFHRDKTNFFEQLAALSTHGLCAVLGNDPPEGEYEIHEHVSKIVDPKTGQLRILRLMVPKGPPQGIKTLRRFIRGDHVYNVHVTPLVLGSYAIVGNEGAPLDERFGEMGTVIYTERGIGRHLALAAKRVRGKIVIVLSHCPPRGVLDLAIRFGRRHIGSIALRRFLLKHKAVPLVVCGHVHFCGAQHKNFRHSKIVNSASHDDFGAPGRIALIEIRGNKVSSVQWHHLWELSSVCGLKDARVARLKLVGINTITELADAPLDRIKQVLKCGAAEASSVKARARALLKRDLIVSRALDIAKGKRAYIDIETDLNGKFIWLVGLHVEEEARTYSFFAKTPAHEQDALTKLFQFLTARPELQLLSYSNSSVEQRLLPQRFSAYGLPPAVVGRIRDIYYAIHASAAFPLQTTTLKEISRWCGFRARHPDIDGFGAALSYGSGNPNKRLKQKLLEYNEDDILSLKHVVQFIELRLTPEPLPR